MGIPSNDLFEANAALLRYYRATCESYVDMYPSGDGGTWVQGRFKRKTIFVMGCAVCERAGAYTTFGEFKICTRSSISSHVLRKHKAPCCYQPAGVTVRIWK